MKPEKPSRKKNTPTAALNPGESTPPPAKPAAPARAAKKVSAAATIPPIPAILLEGDQPPAPPASGPGQRYALGPTPPGGVSEPAAPARELPEAYGTQRLFLAARDPHWLYAHWDLTRDQQKSYNALSTDKHLVLRIFLNEVQGEPFLQVHVHPESTHWFLYVGQAGAKYIGQLGYYPLKGQWVTISTSAATLTPPDDMSDDTTAQFATIPVEIPHAQIIAAAQQAVKRNLPLAEILQQLRLTGQVFHNQSQPAGTGWTPERERALASIITMDRVRRVWMGSIEITELIRRQLGLSSLELAESARPSSLASGLSSLSSSFGGGPRQKGFWFNVNAELIIYGATEPDAQVTIGGREIKLRPDGSFSFRFALPDGEYELPAVAISADRTDGRAAELKFSRETEYRGDVGAHPQDPKLKAPLAENVA